MRSYGITIAIFIVPESLRCGWPERDRAARLQPFDADLRDLLTGSTVAVQVRDRTRESRPVPEDVLHGCEDRVAIDRREQAHALGDRLGALRVVAHRDARSAEDCRFFLDTAGIRDDEARTRQSREELRVAE